MILDRIEAMDKYCREIPHLEEAIRFVRENMNAEPGKYEFDGGYVLVQAGETRPASDGNFEIHKEYLDVQMMMEGHGYIVWNTADNMEIDSPYDAEKDRQGLSGEGTALEMRPGMCCVLYPSDAHKGCRHYKEPIKFRQFVVKIKM